VKKDQIVTDLVAAIKNYLDSQTPLL